MAHPLDHRRSPKKAPKTHHVYRDSKPTEAELLPSAFYLFVPSWRSLMLNLPQIVKLGLIPLFFLAASILCRAIAVGNEGTVTEAIFNGLFGIAVLMILVSCTIILPAYGLMQLRSARAEVADAGEEFRIGLGLFWRYTLCTLWLSVLTVCGTLLLFIPGLFIQKNYSLAPFYVLDREMGVREAFRAAAADAHRYPRAHWDLTLMRTLLIVLFAVPYVGIFLSLPLLLAYSFAPAVRYVELTELARRRK
jgi:hypothetical protein